MAKMQVPGGHMVGVLPKSEKPKPEKAKSEKPKQTQ